MRVFAFTDDRRPDSAAYRGEPEFEPAHPCPLRATASGSVYRSGRLGDEGEPSVDAPVKFGDAVYPAFDRCRFHHGKQMNDRRLSKGDRFRTPETQSPPPRVAEDDPFDPRSPASSIPIVLVRPIADRSPNPSPMRVFAFTDRWPDPAADECGLEFDPARPLTLRTAASGSLYRSGGSGDEGEPSADALVEFGDAADLALDHRRFDRGRQVNDRRLSKGDRFRTPETQDPPPRVAEDDPFDPRSPASSIPIGLVRPIADRSPNPSPMRLFAFTDRRPDPAADEGGPEFGPARPLTLRTAALRSLYRSGGSGDEGEPSADAPAEFGDASDRCWLHHGNQAKDRRPSPKTVLFERPNRKAHYRALPETILSIPAHRLHRA